MEKIEYLLSREEVICANSRIVIPEMNFIEEVHPNSRALYVRARPVDPCISRFTSYGPIYRDKQFLRGNRSVINQGSGRENFRTSGPSKKYRYSPIAPYGMIFARSIDIRRRL